ncbi:MAG TPA: hypothetical protein PK175_11150 [Syntrophales bacterium]|jgi:hypothetical protein|nr:hypothetical protein [Syntrophales bacterium]HQG35422.1 hypothetical protein [Syntrophales bacterium]
MNKDDEKDKPQEPFQVGEFRQEDAEGLVSLFRKVYGDGYPIRLFYDPEAIIAANRDESYISIIARTDSGKVIGATHLFYSAPFKFLYEWGAGLVLKDYRNLGVNNRLAEFLHNEFIPGKTFIEELYGEPVCNHTHLQKSVIDLQYVETALEVALMPAQAYSREKSASGRVATMLAFRCCRPKPHRIFLPPVYDQILRNIYGRLDDARDITRSDSGFPADRATRAESSIFDFSQVARIAIHEAGNDFADCISNLENQALARNAVVFQVWLNLTEPWVGQAVDILHDRAYFFGGALPRWFDGDGLMMQKLLCPPDFDQIVLHSEEARQLLKFIQSDWKRSA